MPGLAVEAVEVGERVEEVLPRFLKVSLGILAFSLRRRPWNPRVPAEVQSQSIPGLAAEEEEP